MNSPSRMGLGLGRSQMLPLGKGWANKHEASSLQQHGTPFPFKWEDPAYRLGINKTLIVKGRDCRKNFSVHRHLKIKMPMTKPTPQQETGAEASNMYAQEQGCSRPTLDSPLAQPFQVESRGWVGLWKLPGWACSQLMSLLLPSAQSLP